MRKKKIKKKKSNPGRPGDFFQTHPLYRKQTYSCRLSRVKSGPVGECVIGLQLDILVHSSLIPDCLVGPGPPYDSTVELGCVMCHGL